MIKLNDFHQFMMNQSPSLAKIVAMNEFQRDALVISCLSLFLEVFGHILISFLSGSGYYIYVMNPKYIMMLVVICSVSGYSRTKLSGVISHWPFAQYIAPKMYIDGVVISQAVATATAYMFYLLSQSKYSDLALPLDRDTYLIYGQVIGFLGLVG